MIFGVFYILRKFGINSLYICPPHLYTVATLPWEIQKGIFQQYYPYIQIIYVTSEEKTVAPLPTTPEKCQMFSGFNTPKIIKIG